jgi:Tfp pilus assembly protein PilZ
MMNSEEQMEKHRMVGRLVELIHKMSADDMRDLLRWLETETSGRGGIDGDRKNVRVDCFVSVDYADSERVFKDYIEDISSTGGFIKTRESFSIGEEVVLSMGLSKEGSAFKIPASVVRIASDGIGVEFNTTSQVQKDIIQSLIESIHAKQAQTAG